MLLADGGLQVIGIIVSFIILFNVAKKAGLEIWICILLGVIGGFLYKIPSIILQSIYSNVIGRGFGGPIQYWQTSLPIFIIKHLLGYLMIIAAAYFLIKYSKKKIKHS